VREPAAVTGIRRKYRVVAPELDERRRRQWAAAEAREAGYGGVSVVARATGLARSTIHAGLRELRAPRRQRVKAAERIRRAGGGRQPLTASDPALLAALLALIEPTTRGDPESPLRWTCKSTARLADELTRQRHAVSPRTVATLLKGAGYSLQANRKTREGASHPDRDAQFRYLAGLITQCHQHRQPAISVDTKKKELVGDFKNGGREWRPMGSPRRSGSMIFSTTSSERRSPMASMTSPTMKAGPASASTMTPRNSPSTRFDGGGLAWAGIAFRAPAAS